MFPFRSRSRCARRNPCRKGLPGRRPLPLSLECLEDRTLPSAATPPPFDVRTFAGLQFEATQFVTSGSKIEASGGVVTIGLIPNGSNDTFHPLLNVNLSAHGTGTFDFSQSSSPNAFEVTNGTIESVVHGATPIWDSAGYALPVSFNIPQMFSANGYTVPAGSGQPISVAGVQFNLTSLGLTNPGGGSTADAQVRLQGTVNLPVIGKALQIQVNGGNYLIFDSTGPHLTGVTAKLHLPTNGGSAGIAGVHIAGDVTVTYSHVNNDTFQIGGAVEVSTDSNGSNHPSALGNLTAGLEIEVVGGQLEELGFSVSAEFKLGGLVVKGDAGNPITFLYNAGLNSYTVSGGLTMEFAGNDIDVNLGYANNPSVPGIVITNGQLTQFNATINGDLHLFGADLTTDGNGLSVSYDSSDNDVDIYGGLTLNIPNAGKTTSITADMGNSSDAGLVIENGSLKSLNLGVSGQFSVGGLTFAVGSAGQPVTVAWEKDSTGANVLAISGTLSVQNLWSASVTLGGSGQNAGIVIKDGHFQLNSVSIHLADIELGAFTIQTLTVTYTSSGSDNWGVAATVLVTMPVGVTVGGSFQVVNGAVDDFSLSAQAAPGTEGLPVGDTGLFITSLSASVQNIDDPSNIIVSGSIGVNYGEQLSVLGHTVSVFRAQGSFTVDRSHLVLQGDAWFGAYQTGGADQPYTGLLGDGSATLTLDWAQKHYDIAVSIGMYDDAFKVNGDFAFDNSGNLLLQAQATLNVPSVVPFIGGTQLAGASFVFEYHPGDLSHSFAAAWVEVDVIRPMEIGFEYDLSKNLKVIGGDDIAAIKSSLNGQTTDNGATYTYSSTFAVPNGATGAVMSVNWPGFGGAQPTVSVTPGTGSAIPQSSFNAATNQLSVVPIPISLPTAQAQPDRTAVQVVGAAGNADVTLPQSTYTLTLVSPVKLSAAPVFGATFTFPQPTISLVSLPNPNQDPVVTVNDGVPLTLKLSGTVDTAFTSQTHLSLYADLDSQGYNGKLIAQNVPFTVDKSGKITASYNWDLSSQLPVPYYYYAVINDGTNVPVRSAYSGLPVEGESDLFVTVADLVHGKTAVGGIPVELSQGGMQVEVETTGSDTGACVFTTALQPNVPYTVALALPDQNPPAWQVDSSTPSPQTIIFTGKQVTVSFGLDELAAIQGTVFDDYGLGANKGATPTGRGGVVVYIDANRNGQLDPGEEETVTDADGNYALHGLNPNTNYQVGMVVPGGYYANTWDTISAATGSDPFGLVTGMDFHILPLAAIDGRVTDASGKPLAGVWVSVYQNGGGLPVATIQTDSDGDYIINGLFPGSYTVAQAPPSGYRQVAPFTSQLNFLPASLASMAPGAVNSVASADFNEDGSADLVYTTSGDAAVYVKYLGNLLNLPPTRIALPFNPVKVVTFNWKGGTGPSVAVFGSNGQVAVLQNTGSSGFTLLPSEWSMGAETPLSVVAADFDGDGFDELAVAVTGTGFLGTGIALLSPSQLHFTPLAFSFASPNQVGLAVGNFDGNGTRALIVNGALSVGGAPGVVILHNNGAGTLVDDDDVTVPSVPPFTGGGAVAVADFNGDGLPDFAATDLTDGYVRYQDGVDGVIFTATLVKSSVTGAGRLVFLPSSGVFPEFPAAATTTFGANLLSNPQAAVVTDLNGDGLPDVVVADGSTLWEFINTSTVNQQIPVTLAPGQVVVGQNFTDGQIGSVSGVVFKDANRDGRLEGADQGQAGVRVFLDTNHNDVYDAGEPTTMTGAGGAFVFKGLANGTYQVGVVPGAGQAVTGTGLATVTVAGGRSPEVTLGVAPTQLNATPPQVVTTGNALSFRLGGLAATTGNALTYRLVAGAPAGAHIDPTSGVFTWQVPAGQAAGNYTMTVRLSDPFNPLVGETRTITVTVKAPPPPPPAPGKSSLLSLLRAALGRRLLPGFGLFGL